MDGTKNAKSHTLLAQSASMRMAATTPAVRSTQKGS